MAERILSGVGPPPKDTVLLTNPQEGLPPSIELRKVGRKWRLKIGGQYLPLPSVIAEDEVIEVDGSYILTETDCFQVEIDSLGHYYLCPLQEINIIKDENKGVDTCTIIEEYKKKETLTTSISEVESVQSTVDVLDTHSLEEAIEEDVVHGRVPQHVLLSSDWYQSIVTSMSKPNASESEDSNKDWHEVATSSDDVTIDNERLHLTDLQYCIFRKLITEDHSVKDVDHLQNMHISISVRPNCTETCSCIDAITKELASLSIDVVPFKGECHLEALQACKQIEEEQHVSCCLLDLYNNRCIIYHKSAQVVHNVKTRLCSMFTCMYTSDTFTESKVDIGLDRLDEKKTYTNDTQALTQHQLPEQEPDLTNKDSSRKSGCELVICLNDVQYSYFKSEIEKVDNTLLQQFTYDKIENTLSIFSANKSVRDWTIKLENKVKNELSIEEVSLYNTNPDEVRRYCKELEAEQQASCFVLEFDKNRCIVYHEAYDTMLLLKHKLNVKLGNVKVTGRKNRGVKPVPDLTQLQVPPSDFNWQKDAKNLSYYDAPNNIKVLVYKASIIKLPVDCIVNAAIDTLQHDRGVACVIAKAAGKKLNEECREWRSRNGKVPVGGNCVTTAGNLPYKCVIHAVGPKWRDYRPHDFSSVRQCEKDLFNAVFGSLKAANKKGMKSIALPAITSAIFGVPEELCVYQYARATLDFCKIKKSQDPWLEEVHFVDVKSSIVQEIQKMFDLMVRDRIEPPYDTSKFVLHRPAPIPLNGPAMRDLSHKQGAYTQHEKKQQIKPFGRQFPVVIGNIFIHKGGIFDVKIQLATILVCVNKKGDAYGHLGDKLMGMIKNFNRYKSEAVQQKQNFPIAFVTGGHGCGYDTILHVVKENYQHLVSREQKIKKLKETYDNILNTAYFDPRVQALILPLIGTGSNDMDMDVSMEAFKASFDEVSLQRAGSKDLDFHLVVNTDMKVDELCKRFNISPASPGGETLESGSSDTDSDYELPDEKQNKDDKNCVICMDAFDDKTKTLDCGHKFCADCIKQSFQHKRACPTCGALYGIVTGDQPEGTMDVEIDYRSLAGYYECGRISIKYNFPDGSQGPNHPNPGQWYKGITRTAYLPNNNEGREVLKMLQIAFKRKLVFTIGHSRTTGQEGVLTWNGIHHKTDTRPNTQFGYPDPTYLSRVKDELAAKEITPADINENN